jgi:hypothetical protein
MSVSDHYAKKFPYFWITAFLIAVLPRITRLIHAKAWFEDTVYLYHAFAIKIGQRPFLDMICPHPPTIETFLSFLYNIFGVSYCVAEVLTAVLMIVTALLIFDICKRLTHSLTALIALAGFSFSPLLFRYHIFEREVFTLFFAALILWLLVSQEESFWLYPVVGVLGGLCVGVKLSGVFIIAAVIFYLLFKGKFRFFLITLGSFVVVGGGIWAYYLLQYGEEAFYQMILLHTIKGTSSSNVWRLKEVIFQELNYLWILGGGGLLNGVFPQKKKILIIALVFLVEMFVFFTFISNTLWEHNMVDFLLPLTIGTAVGLWFIKEVIKKPQTRITGIALLILPVLLFAIFGLLNFRSDYNPWEYISRNEVKEVAEFIHNNTSQTALISAPHYLANEAQRVKFIDYRELIGPYRWMMQVIKAEGYNGLTKYKRPKSWHQMVVMTMKFWRPEVDKALVHGEITAVVWDDQYPEWFLHNKTDKYNEQKYGLLSKSGYIKSYVQGPYIVWLAQKTQD